jgi:hypothetical protein
MYEDTWEVKGPLMSVHLFATNVVDLHQN